MVKVKPAYLGHTIGFNNSSLPLGQRADLHLLYRHAKETANQSLLDMFEVVDEAEIEQKAVENFNTKQAEKKQSRVSKAAGK